MCAYTYEKYLGFKHPTTLDTAKISVKRCCKSIRKCRADDPEYMEIRLVLSVIFRNQQFGQSTELDVHTLCSMFITSVVR